MEANLTNLIFFNSRDELLRIDISKIVYFEADGNYCRQHHGFHRIVALYGQR